MFFCLYAGAPRADGGPARGVFSCDAVEGRLIKAKECYLIVIVHSSLPALEGCSTMFIMSSLMFSCWSSLVSISCTFGATIRTMAPAATPCCTESEPSVPARILVHQ